MQPTSSCLDEPTIRRLASGQMDEQEAAPLERHLRECPHCRAAYDALFTPLIDAMRTYEPREALCEREQIDQLIARLPGCLFAAPKVEDDTLAGSVEGSVAPEEAGNAVPASRSREKGLQFGQYHVLRMLGEGGMGIVYECEDLVLDRRVALKVLHLGSGRTQGQRERFLREARAVASLHHDNIVPVWHVGEEGSEPFLVMPLLAGESLAARLARERPLPLDLVLQVARETAAALVAAHANGLVHRDIKPANLWLEERPEGVRVQVLDFGLVSVEQEAGVLTKTGAILGTAQYMAPEQARGEEDARADLFSLGCVLYELTTGERPFQGPTLMAVLSALENHQPPPPHEVCPDVPRELSDLVMRLLEKDRTRRPASAVEVGRLLAKLGQPEIGPRPTTREPDTTEPPPPQWGTGSMIAAVRRWVVRPIAGLWGSSSSSPLRRWAVLVALAAALLAGVVMFAGSFTSR
jgi:serine/threonine protein kinase